MKCTDISLVHYFSGFFIFLLNNNLCINYANTSEISSECLLQSYC